MSLLEDFKNEWPKALIGLVFVIAISKGEKIYGYFQTGQDLEKKEEIKDVLLDLMIDKQHMNVFVAQALASDTLKVAREASEQRTIKAIAELTEKDSINLRKELRLYMDLRQSETVAKELSKDHLNMKRLPFLVDSIISARVRRTPRTVSH